MFEDALLESAKHSPGKQRTLSTAASLLLQTSFLAIFIVVPLLVSHAVPDLAAAHAPIWLPPLQNPVPDAPASGSDAVPGIFTEAPVLTQPKVIGDLDRHPQPTSDVPPVQLHPTGGAGPLSVFSNSSGPALPANPATKRPPSVLEQGVVLTRVQPIYPHIAIVNRVQGTVHLHAVIAANGNLEALRVLDGHPMLAEAALEAVRQWRFRPYILNGRPIEVQTAVTVNFTLN
ncbi:MAG: TonB family protein [Terriglobales bacterium]